MHGSGRCIGDLLEDGTSVRLLRGPGLHWDIGAPFQIGDIWDLTFATTAARPAPHTEDAIVLTQKFVGKEPNLRSRIVELNSTSEGALGKTFQGMLSFTGNNNGYISPFRAPNFSTQFWIPDRDLTLRADGKHYDYAQFGIIRRGMSYVGEPNAITKIPKGTLVRLSLAGWWKPEDIEMEERCYLQLSGWF